MSGYAILQEYMFSDKDKHETRWIENWYEDEQIVDAVDWFVNRGKKA